MKTILHIWMDDEGELQAETEFQFPDRVKRPDLLLWENGLYLQLAQFLSKSKPEIRRAVMLLDDARRDARINYQELHPDIEARLTLWRRNMAKEKGIPPFIILNQKTLLAIADAAPTTMEALLEVPGVGVWILDQYGADILRIVRSDLEE